MNPDTSIADQECQCSLVERCALCRSGGGEPITVDPVRPDGPAVPVAYSASNDVNPSCGCHLRSKCGGCGSCTSCDGCYCPEE